MIFERRAYLLKPRLAADFWKAQERWNTADVFGPLLERNLFYASHRSGHGTMIVHLYRFADLREWQQLYSDYYGRQVPSYFATVRPWMTRQENAFFRLEPGDGSPLSEDALHGLATYEIGDVTSRRIVETTIDLAPGSLPAFLDAARSSQDREDATGDILSER